MALMNFDKYIDNPSGGASVVTNRQGIKADYRSRFDKVMLREQGQLKYTVYKTNDKDDTYYIHFKIPSEVIENFYYDVVIKLFTTNNKLKSSVQLREYSVQFYSNDPAFVYTFAHAFEKNKLFIEDLKPKMSKQALDSKAKTRNPKDEVWYVKSLFFAYLAMEKFSLFQRAMLNQHAVKYNKRTLLQNIENADTKVQARQEAQEKLDREKRAERKEQKKRNTEVSTNLSPNSNAIPKTSSVSKSSKTRTVGSTKKTGMKKASNKA